MQAIMLPKVMVPEFYQNYILPWSPCSRYLNSLKDLLHNGSNLSMNSTIWMFIAFMVFGLISLISAIYVKKKTS